LGGKATTTRSGCGGRSGATRRRPSRDRGAGLVEHLRRTADGPLHPGLDERLTREAFPPADLHVRSEDHCVGVGDNLRVERVRTGRALGLDVHLVAGVGRGLLERLGGHVRVRDARGARRHRYELHS
jgi:hypothetical protein